MLDTTTATEAGTAAPDEGATQSPTEAHIDNESPEGAEATDGNKAKAQAKGKPKASKAERAESLRKLLKREKDDPNVKFSDAELDLLDEHYSGKLQPSKKAKPTAPKAEDETTTEEPEENPVTDAPEKEEEGAEEAEEEAEEEDAEEADHDPDAQALLKEVGAKSLKDALNKVKQLRAKLGGKDAQAVAKLEKLIQNEQTLWADVKAGVPEAIAHAARVYGIKVQPAEAEPKDAKEDWTAQPKPKGKGNKRAYISEDAFIDPESARIANQALAARDAEIDELRTIAEEFKQEKENNRKATAFNQAKLAVIDEMVQVAQGLPTLKAIPNLRTAISDWYNGKHDPRIDAFNELFDIAQAERCSLKAAAAIKRGQESEKLIVEAEARGRKSAYGHTPNPSLSGQQGGKGERTTYTNLTDAQIDAMAEDHRLIPPDWFDDRDNPVQAKIPKRAWRIFDFR